VTDVLGGRANIVPTVRSQFRQQQQLSIPIVSPISAIFSGRSRKKCRNGSRMKAKVSHHQRIFAPLPADPTRKCLSLKRKCLSFKKEMLVFSYARGNVFQRTGGRLSIYLDFETGLDYLSDRQRSSEISTMSFVQLRRCLEIFVHVRLRRTEVGCKRSCLTAIRLISRELMAGDSNQRFEGTAFTLPRRALMEKQNVAFN
jgi:hypothetical protein